MATLRVHTRIARPADEVWAVVADAGGISRWFPGIETSTVDGRRRSCTASGGVAIEEEIVTCDAELRRFQYRIVGGGMPVESHLGTVDVLEDADGSLVIYSTEISPDSLADVMGPATAGGVQGLKNYLEDGGD